MGKIRDFWSGNRTARTRTISRRKYGKFVLFGISAYAPVLYKHSDTKQHSRSKFRGAPVAPRSDPSLIMNYCNNYYFGLYYTFHALRAKFNLFQSVHFGFITPLFPPQIEIVYATLQFTEIGFEHSGKKPNPDNSPPERAIPHGSGPGGESSSWGVRGRSRIFIL